MLINKIVINNILTIYIYNYITIINNIFFPEINIINLSKNFRHNFEDNDF